MALARIQQANPNLEKLSSGAIKKVRSDVLDHIDDATDLMRNKNNIIIGSGYRLDAKSMAAAGNGFKAGDYKLDIQTVTQQKANSRTVAIAYLSSAATKAATADLVQAFENSLATQDIYLVS
ncbi:hypothetical protein [Pseudomonas tohonis]|uniref:Uncharacterized protein n=1 Tax=Pseudomonas tohonis TaxID=2725477 RepID=A0A6J4E874_9PSED|nr:hypothetical protein [Pseudomonas tohonis]UXY50494.1 hypothetical protein N9L84_16055 [Pseudomonas tohonis]BCG24721.1 hypothetical protein TUM18999_29120 [Pseudomonas tohonis]GJN51920.1 hypothetical protein TUM20286_16720 [Pseudomonas tohonis]